MQPLFRCPHLRCIGRCLRRIGARRFAWILSFRMWWRNLEGQDLGPQRLENESVRDNPSFFWLQTIFPERRRGEVQIWILGRKGSLNNMALAMAHVLSTLSDLYVTLWRRVSRGIFRCWAASRWAQSHPLAGLFLGREYAHKLKLLLSLALVHVQLIPGQPPLLTGQNGLCALLGHQEK